jgi:methenyltetrahydrofolate cyclohydrolase
MSHLTERPFRELVAAFADPSPTPGGGSAAALTASVGLALLAMVAAMKRTRHGSEEDRLTLDRAGEAVRHLGDHALALVEDDAAAYDGVVEAYRRPRATDEERAARRRAVQAALRGAVETPLEVMRTCRAGLTAAAEIAGAGNPSASSDVGVATELLAAAAWSAALNVRVNLGSLDEAGFVAAVSDETARLEAAVGELSATARTALN